MSGRSPVQGQHATDGRRATTLPTLTNEIRPIRSSRDQASPRARLARLMRAVVQDRYGPPEVLRIEEVERPVPGAPRRSARRTPTSEARTRPCGGSSRGDDDPGGEPSAIKSRRGIHEGAHRGRRLPPGDRPDLSDGTRRGGAPLRRNLAQDRQRRPDALIRYAHGINAAAASGKGEEHEDGDKKREQGPPTLPPAARRDGDSASGAREQTRSELRILTSPATEEVIPVHRSPMAGCGPSERG